MNTVHASQNMPRWKCHKVVEAFKVETIEIVPRGGGVELYSSEGVVVRVSSEYVNKHHPDIGGYYVRYEDGYESFSPAQAFEDGYTRI